MPFLKGKAESLIYPILKTPWANDVHKRKLQVWTQNIRNQNITRNTKLNYFFKSFIFVICNVQSATLFRTRH